MAAPILSIASVGYFAPAFVFLFVWVVVYALLTKVKWFGENETVNVFISFLSALLFLIVPEAVQVVAIVTPWVALLAILVMLIVVLFLFLGAKQEAVTKVVTQNAAVLTIIFTLLGIIFLVALSNVFGPFLLTGEGTGFWAVTKRVLFHPRTLGLIFLLVIASYAIRFITAQE